MKLIRKAQSTVVIGFILFCAFIFPSIVVAKVPGRINYQGYLTDASGNAVADGDYTMGFSIYSVITGGTALWSESQSVSLAGGIYNVALGLNHFPDDLFDGHLYLEVEINGEVFSPRQRLLATPFAMKAALADGVVDGAVTTVMIADSAVDSQKLGDNSVTTTKIVDHSLTADDIQDGSTLTEILDDDGSGSGLDADSLDGLNSSDLSLAGHDHWGETWSGSGSGLVLNSSNGDGLRVDGGDDGIQVNSAGDDGIQVVSAGDDGVYVYLAGSPSTMHASIWKNGFEVAGAERNGLHVGRADRDGVHVNSAGNDGVYVNYVDGDGLFVHSADNRGVHVNWAGDDGVYVFRTGSPSTTETSALKNGFEVAGAEGHGLFVGRADQDGVHVASAGSYAGYFNGNVYISGNLTKGSGTFKIDHPLDPENKYLNHSFVESPDMKNIYDGTVTLDDYGEAWVELPEWFETLNRDFRYQLTCIGGFAQVYIAEEIADNHFKIAGGKSGMKVSWQVTGIRQDPWAEANRLPVEEDKTDKELGHYMHPEAYGQPEEKSIEWARDPEGMQRMKEEREKIQAPTG